MRIATSIKIVTERDTDGVSEPTVYKVVFDAGYGVPKHLEFDREALLELHRQVSAALLLEEIP